jgi:hypothetical protein
MPDPKLEIQRGLADLGLTGEELEEAGEQILLMRQELSDSLAKLRPEDTWSGVAIANSPEAIQILEAITDLIIERKGILEMAMRGEDIHDSVAIIKAKLESLIIGGTVQARTLNHITKALKMFKRPER